MEPRCLEVLLRALLDLVPGQGRRPPRAAAGTANCSPGPALPPPGTAALARTYSPRPTLTSGVPAELTGPPGTFRTIPWNTGSRLGRS